MNTDLKNVCHVIALPCPGRTSFRVLIWTLYIINPITLFKQRPSGQKHNWTLSNSCSITNMLPLPMHNKRCRTFRIAQENQKTPKVRIIFIQLNNVRRVLNRAKLSLNATVNTRWYTSFYSFIFNAPFPTRWWVCFCPAKLHAMWTFLFEHTVIVTMRRLFRGGSRT